MSSPFTRVSLFLFLIVAFPFIACAQAPFFDSEELDINNLDVVHGVHGDFWHGWQAGSLVQGCEYPKGSGKHLATSMSLWMGGIDGQGILRAAASTYRQNGQEYWPGPLQGQTTGISYTESEKWARIWKVNKADIQAFLSNPVHTVLNTPAVILERPAKGNIHAMGKDQELLDITDDMAPFIDVNSDGVYNSLDGDYPNMKGEQMLWFVFNDNGPSAHTEVTNCLPIGVQIKAKAYGYSSFDNVVYYEFEVTNHQQDLDSFTLGTFADFDIGAATDDYIGFDSSRNLGYSYNATMHDGTGAAETYGDSIPAAGVRFLEFPGNSCSVGAPLGSFMYFNNRVSMLTGNPANGQQVYWYLNHSWVNGSPLVAPYGNWLEVSTNGTGNGSPVNYAYDGSPGLASEPWTECAEMEQYDDRRMVMGIKPFAFQKGDMVKLAFALVASPRKLHNGCPSYDITDLQTISDSAQYVYCNPIATRVAEVLPLGGGVKVYPNPAHDVLYLSGEKDIDEVKLVDVHGRLFNLAKKTDNTLLSLDMSRLLPGMYFLIYKMNGVNYRQKIIKQ